MHHHCVIVGSGPAGYTAAIYAARANLNPILYTGTIIGGQLTQTTDVENFPGYPDGVMGPEMMEDLRKQAARFGTDIRYALVTNIDFAARPYRITAENGDSVTADTIIISTGATAKWLGLPAEQRLNGSGVSACAVCDGFFYRGQDVAVVGGGDTACEEASYLSKLCKSVTMIVRKGEFRASKIMSDRVLNTANIKVLWHSETVDILGEHGVTGARIRNVQTNAVTDIDVTGFFVAIGHHPNTELFKGVIDMDSVGYIVTHPKSTHTNLEGVFACGDAQDNVYRQAVTAAGTGCMAALDAERYLAEKGII